MVFLTSAPLAMDEFGIHPGCIGYFLSHFHTDHTKGLHRNWNTGTIYCSGLTKELLVAKYSINPGRIQEVYDEQTIFLRFSGKEELMVTFFDAHHCPGSLMCLVQTKFENMLYTGDFRYKTTLADKIREGRPLMKIDRMFLDTTFREKDFPTREKAANDLIEYLSLVPNLDRKILFIGVNNLGKETLVTRLSKKFNRRVLASPERYATIQVVAKYLDRRNPVKTTNDDDWFQRSGIRIPDDFYTVNLHCFTDNVNDRYGIILYPLNKLTHVFMKQHPNDVAIIPSAMHAVKDGIFHNGQFIYVPYSDHSSSSEIAMFEKEISARMVFGLDMKPV